MKIYYEMKAMSKVQSYERSESMFNAFKRKCHEREGLSHLKAALSTLHNMDVTDIDDDIEDLVLDCCLFSIRESTKILTSRTGDREHWYKVLMEFSGCEILPSTKIASCVVKARELLKEFDSQEEIAALRWLHEGGGLDDVYLHRISGGLNKCQKKETISYYRDRRLVDIEALAELRSISFGRAQQALLQYPPLKQEKILKNTKIQEISRRMRREIWRKILSVC